MQQGQNPRYKIGPKSKKFRSPRNEEESNVVLLITFARKTTLSQKNNVINSVMTVVYFSTLLFRNLHIYKHKFYDVHFPIFFHCVHFLGKKTVLLITA